MRAINLASQRGNMLTTVVVVVLALATLGVILATMSSADSALQLFQQEEQRAFYAAQSGLEYGIKRYLNSDDVEEFETEGLDIGNGAQADITLEDNDSVVVITSVGKAQKALKKVQTVISSADENYVPDYAVFTANTANGVYTLASGEEDNDPDLLYQNAPTVPKFDLENLKSLAKTVQEDGNAYYYEGDLTVDDDFEPPDGTVVYAEGNIRFEKGSWDGTVYFVSGGDATFASSWQNNDSDVQMLLYLPGSLQKIKVEPVVASDPIEFEVEEGEVIPTEDYVASVTVIGGDLPFGFWIIYPFLGIAYDAPITLSVRVGDHTVLHPFGPDPSSSHQAPKWEVNRGNINDGNNPRTYVLPDEYDADTPISISACSWELITLMSRNYRRYMRVNSVQDLDYVYALRDGDPVPDVAPFGDQRSAAEFVRDYIDFNTQRMSLGENQVIYLFELADETLSTPAADFQDLVVMVNLAREKSQLADDEDDDDDHQGHDDDDDDDDEEDDDDDDDNPTRETVLSFKGGIISEGKIIGVQSMNRDDVTYTNRLQVVRDKNIIKNFLKHSVNGNARVILASTWKTIK